MELSSQQQIFEVVEKSKKVLLLTRQHPAEDAVCSLIALGLYLEKSGKEVDMVTQGPIPPVLEFIPETKKVKSNVRQSKNFVVSLDTSETKVAQFSYDFDKDGKNLNIFITPEGGSFTPEHLSTKILGFGYDTVFIIHSTDFESLGPVYTESADLFYETPVINIDCSSSNEQFGEVNLVDTTASSIAEILYELFAAMGEKVIDERIATCLLTGIIASTRSFQNTSATPKSFNIAAKLIAAGADQQQVINSLYKNRSLSMLKLWGRALARVKHSPEKKLAWSMLNQKDFVNSGARTEDLEGITDEIMTSVPNTDVVVVLYEAAKSSQQPAVAEAPEQTGGVEILVKSNKESHINQLAEIFDTASRNGVMKIKISGISLAEVERDVLEKVKSVLG
ncbi:MAG: hypothetical protein HQ530_04325 [Parcubacteria group bacterium]|nr:hypothetical protein [Parcubacteria group bacterium]